MSIKRTLFALFAVVGLSLVGYLGWHLTRSPAFFVREIRVFSQSNNDPFPTSKLKEKIGSPKPHHSIFFYPLREIEEQVLLEPWVKSVILRRVFPSTITVQIRFRSPVAYFQRLAGGISLVEDDGTLFEAPSLALKGDLPVLVGHEFEDPEKRLEALQLIRGWADSAMGKLADIGTLQWTQGRGYQAWISYRSEKRQEVVGRTLVELGPSNGADFQSKYKYLYEVLAYITHQGIQTHQIFVGDGKKIVVRTTRGS